MTNRDPILVTGGAGYIGSHVCKTLADAGFLPVTYDNLSRGHDWAVKWGPLEQGDVLDRARLDAVLSQYDFAGVMHFAALIEVAESVKHPARFYRANVGGTATVVEAMAAKGLTSLVFSSTAAVYGAPTDNAPLPETTPLAPINPYGATKYAAETMICDAHDAHGINAMRLRYFNAAGADADGDTGEEHDPETHLVPLALRAIQSGAPLKLFGTDYPTPDGTALRDYVHVADLADAHVAALLHLMEGGKGEALNLGSGHGTSVREVLDAADRVTGTPVPFEKAPRRPGDPAMLVADSTRAQSLLKQSFSRSQNIDVIIQSAWDWITAHRDKAMTTRA